MIKILNLSQGFAPFGTRNSIPFEHFRFSGGEPHIRVDKFWDTDELFNIGPRQLPHETTVLVTTRINKGDDLLLFGLAVNALRNMGVCNIYAFIPYFPGARQDRIGVRGEPLTVRVYADWINALRLDRVYIYDPHSDVTPAIINKCVPISNQRLVEHALLSTGFPIQEPVYLVSPDAGARKKVTEIAKNIDPIMASYDGVRIEDVLYCDKKRDVKTGKLSGFTVPSGVDLSGTTCIIVDDICDGGGTFLGLGERLKQIGAEKLYLIVSHGIFSKGFSELNKMFDGLITTNSIRDWSKETIKYYQGVRVNLEVIDMKDVINWSTMYHAPDYTPHSIDA